MSSRSEGERHVRCCVRPVRLSSAGLKHVITLQSPRAMRISGLALLLVLSPAVGRGQVPESVRSRLVQALEPVQGQELEVARESASVLFPGATFFRARRQVPPYPSGEDARPRVATVIATERDTLVVAQFSDLEAAWKTLAPQVPSTPAAALKITTCLFKLTGLVSARELITSTSDARRKAPARAFAKPEVIRLVRPPRASTSV